ncbi:RNA polymerase sigma factor [Planctomyces sp. SH-PL14]|uniref:RNA polymerase sigma factor n=1 Tax=Planctomyces sp. SH-PL14 TaxID=1632864 RepID=UPI0009466E98|nr:sigma-70 family RNA polymerase sigma factor [Planctomyces sp. SH-PL14]
MDDDQTTVETVLAGETTAFRRLVERHERLVFTFVHNMLRRPTDAEDVTQETFLAAYRSLRTFDPRRARFATWLLTIARNECLSVLGRRPPPSPMETVPDPLSRATGPLERLGESELWTALDQALDLLPLDQRTAFVLAEIQQLPHAEIATIEAVEIGTIKSRVSRAKDRLRTLLRAFQPEPRPAAAMSPPSTPAAAPSRLRSEIPHES